MPHLQVDLRRVDRARVRLDKAIKSALERDKQIHEKGHVEDPPSGWEAEYEDFAGGPPPEAGPGPAPTTSAAECAAA
jgi:hypothetical protein